MKAVRSDSGTFWAGTSGVVLSEPNKSAYPEEFRNKSRLSYYSSLFNSVEINSSFYRLPMQATFGKWAAGVGEEFRFTVKLARDITHAKNFAYQPADIERFMLAADRVDRKKGCLLIQLPPSLTDRAAGRLDGLIRSIRAADPEHSWKIAVEFRHPSWYWPGIYELLDKYLAGVVLQDMPASATRELNEKAPFVYLRFHGPAGDYKGGYTREFLQQQANDIKNWLREGKDVYAYFNNTIGDAVPNLAELNRLIG
jgi:uncharacterized protein YecE (DUF72 family)